jgi:hypothetical protein
LANSRPINWRHLTTVLSVMVLVGTEVFGVALAAGWAIAGLLELGDVVGYALMGLFSLAALYAMVQLWQRWDVVEPVWGSGWRGNEAGARELRPERRAG